ncbi:MAG: PAS domain-containing protein [Saccharospirillum sp.]|nr:PAS domain-containing protein [Saccharospirillum sp.]
MPGTTSNDSGDLNDSQDSNKGAVHSNAHTVESNAFKDKDDAERIRESERRLAAVIEGTNIGTWEWNVQTGQTVFNQRWAEIVGYRLEELEPISIDTWMGLAHPDDLAESARLLKQHFSGETNVYDCKARMRHKAGHWVWVHDRGRVFEWTPDGEPLMMFGTHADITHEVEAKRALQESRDELASLVANMPGVTYRCLLDENWTMLFMSHHVDQVSGYSAEDLIGNKRISYAELIHPDDMPAITAEVEQAIAAGRNWRIDYRIKHRDGDWRWVEERGRAVKGEAHHPVVLEGFLVDITREQQVKAQLAKHHDALALLNDIAFNTQGDMSARITHALRKAYAFLGMDVGILSQIEGQVYRVGWIAGPPELPIQPGEKFKLGQTWCQLLASRHHDELFISDIPESDYHAHPCMQYFPLGAYAGIAIEVEGRLFGTLNFSSSSARATQFDESEVMFVRLLARWVAGILGNNVSNERMAKLLAQLPGVVYQYRAYPDGQNTFPFSSPQIHRLYGMTPDEAAVDAIPAFEKIHPDDMSAVLGSIERSRTELENWNAIYRTNTTDHGYRWVAGQARPERLSDGSTLWHGYIQDIHEQEQARRALERNESRLRGLFEFSPIGIALNDFETGKFLELNEALLAPTGYSREEFVRLSYWEVTPVDYKPEEEKALADLKARGRYGPFEKEYIRKDGSRYPVRLQGMLSQDADGRAVIWSLIEDISERKRVERMKNEFISTVSHELRTPLTSISGALSLIASGVSGELPDTVMKVLDIAQRNSQRLGLLINDLLDMEKLVAGKMELNMAVQPVLDIVRTALADNQAYADRFAVTLELIEPRQNPGVNVDAGRLEQVLANLLSNAAKFSPEGEAVQTEVRVEKDQVKVTVKDRGPGIAASFRPRLFEKFSQADASDRRSKSGTGLGLAISKELIEQMGGSIGVYSVEGQGAEFYIELPLMVQEKSGEQHDA